MAKTSSVFQQRVIDSQLIDARKVREYLSRLQAGREAVTEKEFATALVKAGELTPYQARAIYQGKGKNLILGNYAILEKIGVGGMGRIYRAKHLRMDRIVALKILPPEMTSQDDALQRFHREVKAAARLSHPNIVMAYDADVANGLHFMVMEYVEGTDLSSLVKQHGPISVPRTVKYIRQAAQGIQYAHLQNVIHRDIKPGNLMLDQSDTIKILDMGLARINDCIRSASSINLTKTNVVMGTVDFMSPEQALNSKFVDERADIYSLGMTMYYLLTGKPAYGGETAVERLLAHRDAPLPSLLDKRSDVDPRLDEIFQKMIAKSSEARYQSMTEVIEDLTALSLEMELEPSQSDCHSSDSKLNAFILSLETVPAFVPRPCEADEARDTSNILSNMADTDPDKKALNFDLSADRESILKHMPVKNDSSFQTVIQNGNNHTAIAILGTVLAIALAALCYMFGASRSSENRPTTSKPAASISEVRLDPNSSRILPNPSGEAAPPLVYASKSATSASTFEAQLGGPSPNFFLSLDSLD